MVDMATLSSASKIEELNKVVNKPKTEGGWF